MNKTQGRNLELDRLRAFAVLMSIFIHYSRVFFPWNIHKGYEHGGSILNLLQNSWTGVDLFFVISGYIISKMIVDKIDGLVDDKSKLMQFIKNFYIRRFYRIYPIACTFFIFVLLCSLFFNASGSFSTPENNIEAGITIFTYSFNYFLELGHYHAFTLSPYWSLSVEEQFYLIFPFFLILVRSYKQRILILIGLILTISLIIRPLSPEHIFYTQNRCDGLIYGCLLYYVSIQSSYRQLFKPIQKISIASIASIFIMLFLLGTITSVGFPNTAIIPLGCIVATILVAIAVLELNIISFGGVVNAILGYLGSRSYCLYIVHFPMFTFTQELFFRIGHTYNWELNNTFAVPYTALAFILTLLVSELAHRFIERPCIEQGRDLTHLNIDKNPKERLVTTLKTAYLAK